MNPAPVFVGTSGWHYPTGRGTWNGVFYPARRPRGFDELAYYAEHFDVVEVNSTFYRMPDPGHVSAWAARTPRDFRFAIKLFQKFTHPDMYLSRSGVSDWDLSLGDVDAFRAGVAPLADAGRLSSLLLQFPASFHAESAMRDYLSWLLDAFGGYPLAVELRHKSWFMPGADTRTRLRHHQAALVVADAPELPAPFNDEIAASGDGALYIRMHGRNAGAWWNHAHAEDRYNYLYSPTELRPVATAAQSAAAQGRPVTILFNNHFSAKAVANAAVLKSQLGQELPGEYEREMVALYPELAPLVRATGLPL